MLFRVLGWTRGVVLCPTLVPPRWVVMLSRETSCHCLPQRTVASRTVMAMAQVVNRLRPWN